MGPPSGWVFGQDTLQALAAAGRTFVEWLVWYFCFRVWSETVGTSKSKENLKLDLSTTFLHKNPSCRKYRNIMKHTKLMQYLMTPQCFHLFVPQISKLIYKTVADLNAPRSEPMGQKSWTGANSNLEIQNRTYHGNVRCPPQSYTLLRDY